MSDIFISYKREEQDKARQLADALEKQGWSVWWDPKLRAGEYFDDVIERALKEARCVIVLWSKQSVQSRYVKDESSYALNHGKLVPVAIEKVELPFRFRGIQTPQLVDWDGSEKFPAFVSLVADIAEKLGQPATAKPASAIGPAVEEQPEHVIGKRKPTPSIRTPSPRASPWITVTAITALVAVVAVLVFTTSFERKHRNVEITSKTDNGSMLITTEAKVHRVAGEVIQDTLKGGSKGPKMVFIAGGKFEMGSSLGFSNKRSAEYPRHEVTIEPFYISTYEVTFEDYDAFVRSTGGETPSAADYGWGRGQRPVVHVSWPDAVAYTEWLSEETGKRYRLPSEAEWEYAARAGTDTTFWWGNNISQIGEVWANCDGCGSQWDNKQTAPVGSFEPNAFGVYDTAGNAAEWVQDCWHYSYFSDFGSKRPDDGSAWEAAGGECDGQRVFRGGAWSDEPWDLRSEYRSWHPFSNRNNTLGFRVARDRW